MCVKHKLWRREKEPCFFLLLCCCSTLNQASCFRPGVQNSQSVSKCIFEVFSLPPCSIHAPLLWGFLSSTLALSRPHPGSLLKSAPLQTKNTFNTIFVVPSLELKNAGWKLEGHSLFVHCLFFMLVTSFGYNSCFIVTANASYMLSFLKVFRSTSLLGTSNAKSSLATEVKYFSKDWLWHVWCSCSFKSVHF